jgi:hypothetical protein
MRYKVITWPRDNHKWLNQAFSFKCHILFASIPGFNIFNLLKSGMVSFFVFPYSSNHGINRQPGYPVSRVQAVAVFSPSRPWRSYAVLHLWRSPSPATKKPFQKKSLQNDGSGGR